MFSGLYSASIGKSLVPVGYQYVLKRQQILLRYNRVCVASHGRISPSHSIQLEHKLDVK